MPLRSSMIKFRPTPLTGCLAGSANHGGGWGPRGRGRSIFGSLEWKRGVIKPGPGIDAPRVQYNQIPPTPFEGGPAPGGSRRHGGDAQERLWRLLSPRLY